MITTLMMWVYLLLLVVGFVMVGLSFMLGGIGDVSADGGADAGGDAGVDAGADHDVGGHDAGGDHDGARGLSPVSPLVLSLFATYFGAFGFIFTFGFPSLNEILIALLAVVATVVLSAGSYFALVRLFVKSQASSVHQSAEVIGSLGEVTTAIPKGGVGVVDYVARGSRVSNSAKSAEPCARGDTVRITKVVNNVLHVEKVKELDRKELEKDEKGGE